MLLPEVKEGVLAKRRHSVLCTETPKLTINSIAWSEIFQTIAHIFRRFEFALHDTNEDRDVTVLRDCSIGLLHPQSVGVRVKVSGLIAE